jgi:putative oxidoreductase
VDESLLIMRLVVGLTMAAHGAQKLFGWFGGQGLRGTAGMFAALGFRPPIAAALLGGTCEFGGGLLLAAGLGTPLGAAAIAGVMFVATALVNGPKGFFNIKGGCEFNLVLAGTAIGAAFGPGRWSLDAALGWRLSGIGWGLAALATAVLAAGGAVATRHSPAPAPGASHALPQAR